MEENRLLRRQLGNRRLRLTDDDRRRLAARAHRVGRAALRTLATITYYTVFIIDLASRRVQILGSTPHPEALFMQQVVPTLTSPEPSAVGVPRTVICDRDRKWSADVQRCLRHAGIRVVLIPARAPNAKGEDSYCTSFVA